MKKIFQFLFLCGYYIWTIKLLTSFICSLAISGNVIWLQNILAPFYGVSREDVLITFALFIITLILILIFKLYKTLKIMLYIVPTLICLSYIIYLCIYG